jgi:hypothetical protein
LVPFRAAPPVKWTFRVLSISDSVRRPALRGALLVVSLMFLPDGGIEARRPAVAPPALSAMLGSAQGAGSLPRLAGWARSALGSIDPAVFALALRAASCAVQAGRVANPPTLTVIDYSKPSTERRLWVFDLRSRELAYEEFVAHGQGSGVNVATMFSNEPETHRSSLGLFVTEDAYVGKNGYSLHLNGLDAGFNDRARERAIVVHGASYVSEKFVQAQGRLGRSWGCPALPEGIARQIIDRVKGGSLIFAYYPDLNWLASSRFLGGCAAAH